MPTFCTCPQVHICIYKQQVDKVLTKCKIDADKDKCCYAVTADEMTAKIKEVK